MFKRIVLLATLLALAVPAQASAVVTIKLGGPEAKYREVLYPDPFRIKGKTGDYRGPVALEVDDFPYDGGGEIATVQTDDKGEYVFPKVVLDKNTKVRVRAGSEFSKTIELFVHPGVKFGMKELSRGRVRPTFTYIGHPGFAPPPDAFYVYILKTHESKLRRLDGPASMTRIGDGRWRYRRVLREPASKRTYRYDLLYCTKGLSAAGYGRFWRIDRSCGDKVIPFPDFK